VDSALATSGQKLGHLSLLNADCLVNLLEVSSYFSLLLPGDILEEFLTRCTMHNWT